MGMKTTMSHITKPFESTVPAVNNCVGCLLGDLALAAPPGWPQARDNQPGGDSSSARAAATERSERWVPSQASPTPSW
jgi:hypothetical protein